MVQESTHACSLQEPSPDPQVYRSPLPLPVDHSSTHHLLQHTLPHLEYLIYSSLSSLLRCKLLKDKGMSSLLTAELQGPKSDWHIVTSLKMFVE